MKTFAALPFARYQSTSFQQHIPRPPVPSANSPLFFFFSFCHIMEGLFSILNEMEATFKVLDAATRSLLQELRALLPALSQVSQQQVNALVELGNAIDKAQLDSEARKRASLHWLILYEQMRLKNDEAPQARGALDLRQLSAHAHKRLGAVRHEEVDAFADWMSRQSGGQESSGFEPLTHIRAHASANESGEGGSLDCTSSAGFSI